MANSIFIYGSKLNNYGWKNKSYKAKASSFSLVDIVNNYDRYSSRIYIHHVTDSGSNRLAINNLSQDVICSPPETTPTPPPFYTTTPVYTTIPPTPYP